MSRALSSQASKKKNTTTATAAATATATMNTKRHDEHLDVLFHALSDTTRRRIIDRLSKGAVSVGELAEPFSISLAAISKHLDVLENAGLLHRERDGRFQRCSATFDALDDASAFIEHYRVFWEANLDQLAEYLEGTAPPASAPPAPPGSPTTKGRRRR